MKILFLTAFFLLFSLKIFGDNIPMKVKEASKGIAKIHTPKWQATGFFINRHTLATSAHNILDENGLIPLESIIIDHTDNVRNIATRVIGLQAVSLLHDFALLTVKHYYGATLELGDLIPREKVYFSGFPSGKKAIMEGTFLRKRDDYHAFTVNFLDLLRIGNWDKNTKLLDAIMLSNLSSPLKGGSGGPILNSNGQVVGVLSRAAGTYILFVKTVHMENVLHTHTSTSESTNQNKNENLLNKELFYTYQIAQNGDAHAQYVLGNLYNSGECVKKNLQKAQRWYKRAASQGYTQALLELGVAQFIVLEIEEVITEHLKNFSQHTQ